MNKAFTNFEWKNSPNTSTPLNATNLNKINTALNTIDDRVIDLNKEVEKNSVTLSASDSTTVEITSSDILATSYIFPFCDVDGIEYSSMTIIAGKCTLVFPKQDSSITINIRLRLL